MIFGAVLSSFNSGLNSAATLFSVDIYKGVINRDATESQMVSVGKKIGIVIAIGAICVAPLIAGQESLFTLMKKLAALYNIPLIGIVVVGMFSKRAPSTAAIAGILTGFVFYAIFGLYFGNTIFGQEFHWLHVAGINFGLVVFVMAAVTLVKPRPEPYVATHSGDVDITPWKGAVPAGIGILILIGLMYWGMSFFGR